ncbi:MAG: outer membrane protein assembly factor BamD [Saprospiraceae bacterium]|nr:outer membrane protein assembly factor BamD [Saprospiraceae bacterium]
MKKASWILFLIVFLGSCKSEFEGVRQSGDPERIYKKAEEYYDLEEYYKAQSLFELAIPAYRGKELAETLFYKYAYTFYYTGEYILASHYFKNFANTFYNSPKREEMDFMSSYSLYKLSPNYKLDQSYTDKAIEGFQVFVNTYPNSERIEEINGLIDEMRDKQEKKSYEQAYLYYNIGQFQAAVVAFDNFLKDYPGSEMSEEARFLKLKSSFIISENSIYEKQEERYDKTLKYYTDFMKKHPESKWLNEARDIYENSIKELKKFGRV